MDVVIYITISLALFLASIKCCAIEIALCLKEEPKEFDLSDEVSNVISLFDVKEEKEKDSFINEFLEVEAGQELPANLYCIKKMQLVDKARRLKKRC